MFSIAKNFFLSFFIFVNFFHKKNNDICEGFDIPNADTCRELTHAYAELPPRHSTAKFKFKEFIQWKKQKKKDM